ncbi:GNAT family N-acetyltransferase [Allosalinactinospora lopnorensis]|uniref:GNAT family N-acetyltransferase n=1 Tax=Allosalinactinospora lopnorensis TaxID=1352348 RepID=UPI000AD27527|nr:GNAT family N-acetyltransferase [Allosalinactinospora lopnorensis]
MAAEPGADVAHALLTDGAIVVIRPARAEDAPEVRRMHEAMSSESQRMRFFVPSAVVAGQVAERVCAVQDADRRALLAVLDGEIVGMASYDATGGPGAAEVALAVADHVRGRGVGTLLLEHLASLARENGIAAFTAEVLASNYEMQRVFTDAGMRLRQRTEAGVVEMVIPLDQDDHYLDAVGRRESRAERESLNRMLRPGVVAVIGGTRRAVSVGNAILRNICASGYTGHLHAVHPRATGVVAYHSVAELPETPDLAVIAVPPDSVLEVAVACGERGVGALVAITSGLAPQAGRELLTVCREHGMRLVGPNCFGIANMEAGVGLHATFAARPPARGQAGVVVQSGGVGVMLPERLSRLGSVSPPSSLRATSST